MEFVLNGSTRELSADTVRTKVKPVPPDPIHTHWVEIDGRRWPPKQAFRLALGTTDEPFISHFALRVFQKLGFQTSTIPGSRGDGWAAPCATALGDEEQAIEAFRHLDQFLSTNALTRTLADLESRLDQTDAARAQEVASASGLDDLLVDSALVVRERIGMLDTLIHAAVITFVLPHILLPGEKVVRRPSLGAGNDPERVFDLETTHRVAEFKVASWKGHDGMRQRGLFADVVGLSLDTSGRRREVYVVGELPIRFLQTSNRNAVKTLSKAALRLRTPEGLDDSATVASFTAAARVDVIDLRQYLPSLR